jgi:hypothetical protein
MVKKGISIIITTGILVFMGMGCASLQGNQTGWKATDIRRSPFEHVVKWPDETLQNIAEWYTGNADNWKSLADANPQIDSNNLIEGNVIFIPENLLKNRKAFPKSFVSVSHEKPKPKPSPEIKKTTEKPKPKTPSKPPKKKKDEKDEFELFGPK